MKFRSQQCFLRLADYSPCLQQYILSLPSHHKSSYNSPNKAAVGRLRYLYLNISRGCKQVLLQLDNFQQLKQ